MWVRAYGPSLHRTFQQLEHKNANTLGVLIAVATLYKNAYVLRFLSIYLRKIEKKYPSFDRRLELFKRELGWEDRPLSSSRVHVFVGVVHLRMFSDKRWIFLLLIVQRYR